jgi:hypothetical protein
MSYNSCSPSNGNQCDCNVINTCTTNCTISDATKTIQGTFQNGCCPIREESTIVMAYLSNVRNNNCQPDVRLTLDPICLPWCDFLLLFYRLNSSFGILPTAYNTCPISFFNRTYANTTNTQVSLNLGQLVRSAWASKCETTIDNLDAKTSIQLTKDVSRIGSLLSAKSALTLSLDEVIESLLLNGEIAPADSTKAALVTFVVQYKYCFEPLNVCVIINFPYTTRIPCYTNARFCDTWCPTYSKDPCLPCGLLQQTNKSLSTSDDIMNLLSKNNFDNESTGGFSDDNSQQGDESIGDLSKGMDDKTFVSLDSSKW